MVRLFLRGFVFHQETHIGQQLVVCSVEIHVNTRGNLLPNPDLDPVSCIFYCLWYENPTACPDANGHRPGFHVGMFSVKREPVVRLPDTYVVGEEFETEEGMLRAFMRAVVRFDPDILVGYEIHNASIGYLIERCWKIYEFRLPELDSVAKILGIDVDYDISAYHDDNPFLEVEISDSAAAKLISERCILIKSIYELWTTGTNYDEILNATREISNRVLNFGEKSWKFKFVVFGSTIEMDEQIRRINRFSFLPVRGPVNMKSPDITYAILEDYEKNDHVDVRTKNLQRVFFGIWIADGNRSAISKFDVKSRTYIGTTSMDAELSLVMANMALSDHGKLIMDPFVGTGSFLCTCSHFGAFTLGCDIDGRQMRGLTKSGHGTRGIKSNISQYGIEKLVLDCVICDLAHHPWRNTEWIDAIVTDPPYGIRAGAKKIGRRDDSPEKITEDRLNNTVTRRPKMLNYSMVEVIDDLVMFAARELKVGGRLVFWLPTVTEDYEPTDIPRHPALRLIANSEQPFNKWARRLITMEKIVSLENSELPCDEMISAPTPAHAKFREVYYTPTSGK